MDNSLAHSQKPSKNYTAADIEVLEGIEPVRRRPGMFVGSTDENGLHHLAAELLDNAMDEIVAGAASRMDVELAANNVMKVSDNGRGIPVDPHPKYTNRSALEIIMTTLHSGGKFRNEVYKTRRNFKNLVGPLLFIKSFLLSFLLRGRPSFKQMVF